MEFNENRAARDGDRLICLTDVSKRFGTLSVLEHLHLEVVRGDCIKIDGESGAGKTTLLRVLMGLEAVDEGTVQRAKQVRLSAVFQEDRLLMQCCIADNLRFVHADEARMAEIAQALGLDETDKRAVHMLSGGQRRRVALARALLAPSELLLLDEPFTGLDEEAIQRAQRTIATFRAGRALVLASHIDEGDWLPFRHVLLT